MRTTGFSTTYGRDLVPELTNKLGRYALVCHAEPWALVQPTLVHLPDLLIAAGDLTVEHLEHLVSTLPSVDAIVGLGGGSAMDTAKWLHWRSDTPLYQVPSLPSVDACFTRMTALRDGGGVRYEGDAVPELVLVDFGVIGSAPPALVRGGIGDVLSCHTARFDWELAVRAGHDHPWDDDAAAAARWYLDELEALAPLLATGDDEGIRRLMECHRDIGWRCHSLGHARFEEGSEHFFAYAFEEVTGHTIMHGELVTLGVLVMSTAQDNDLQRPRRIADAAKARTRIADLGILWTDVEATLRRLPSFVEEQGLWYSIANGLMVDDELLALVRTALRLDGEVV